MAKELPFFQFEPAMWMMGRIQRCTSESKAAFIDLCCRYWNAKCEYLLEDAQLDCGENEMNELIKKKVIKQEAGFVIIGFLDEQYDNCLETKDKKRKAANARWGKSKAGAMHVHKDAKQKDAYKKKEEKKKQEENIIYFVDESLNEKYKEWLLYRKEIKKKSTPRSIKMQVKDLSKYSVEVAIECINTSIRNNWQGLFPDKIKINGQQGTTDQSYADTFNKITDPNNQGSLLDGQDF